MEADGFDDDGNAFGLSHGVRQFRQVLRLIITAKHTGRLKNKLSP